MLREAAFDSNISYKSPCKSSSSSGAQNHSRNLSASRGGVTFMMAGRQDVAIYYKDGCGFPLHDREDYDLSVSK